MNFLFHFGWILARFLIVNLIKNFEANNNWFLRTSLNCLICLTFVFIVTKHSQEYWIAVFQEPGIDWQHSYCQFIKCFAKKMSMAVNAQLYSFFQLVFCSIFFDSIVLIHLCCWIHLNSNRSLSEAFQFIQELIHFFFKFDPALKY